MRWQLIVLLISISLVVSVRCHFWQKLCFWEGGRAGSPWSRVKADRLSCHKYCGLGEGEGILYVKSGGSRFGSASNSASLFLHLAWASLPRFPHCLNFPILFLEETRPSGAVSQVTLTWSCGWQAALLRKWYLLSTLSAVLLQCVPFAEGVGAPGMQGSPGPAGLTRETGAPGEPGAPGRAGAAGEQRIWGSAHIPLCPPPPATRSELAFQGESQTWALGTVCLQREGGESGRDCLYPGKAGFWIMGHQCTEGMQRRGWRHRGTFACRRVYKSLYGGWGVTKMLKYMFSTHPFLLLLSQGLLEP